MLYMAKNMQCRIFDSSVLPFRDEATQRFPEPFDGVHYMMHMVQLWFQALADMCEKRMKLGHHAPKLSCMMWCVIRPCAEHPKKNVLQMEHPQYPHKFNVVLTEVLEKQINQRNQIQYN